MELYLFRQSVNSRDEPIPHQAGILSPGLPIFHSTFGFIPMDPMDEKNCEERKVEVREYSSAAKSRHCGPREGCQEIESVAHLPPNSPPTRDQELRFLFGSVLHFVFRYHVLRLMVPDLKQGVEICTLHGKA